MTNTNLLLLFQSARDLFRTPILPQQLFHPHPCFGCEPGHSFLSAFHGQPVGLLWTIAALPSIAFQFAADRGFVDTNHCCNLRTRMSCFPECKNLVSLLLGKLVVGAHQCSF